jgi:hypothetical protein
MHLYFETYEVFAREHPNVLSNKNKIKISKSSNLKMSNETLNFLLYIGHNSELKDFLNYFEIRSSYYIDGLKTGHVNLTECTKDELASFSKYIKIDEIKGIKLCPRINFLIPVDSFNKFEWYIKIKKCKDESEGCKKNKELYEKLRNGQFRIWSASFFMSFQENMLNSTHPYDPSFDFARSLKQFSNINIQLKGSEIKTQSLFGLYETESKLKFGKSDEWEIWRGSKTFTSLSISFNSKDMTFYQRNYKTFTGAFSGVYSLFKLYSWVFSILLGIHYSYNINNIIIEKNFDYASSINNQNYMQRRQTLNFSINDIGSSREGIFKEFKMERNKAKRLTMPLVYTNVSCWRFLFCKRKNLTKRFYDNSTKLIRQYLSIEQLLLYLIEFSKVKDSLVLYNLNINEIEKTEKTEKIVLDLMGN